MTYSLRARPPPFSHTVPELTVLYLHGNPVVKKIRHYRKTILGRIPRLKYLDDRALRDSWGSNAATSDSLTHSRIHCVANAAFPGPVFDDERSRVNVWYAAWLAGGDNAAAAAEREEIERLRVEKEQNELRNHLAFADLIRRGVEDRAAAGGSVDSTPASSGASGDEAPLDARIPVKESAEAAAAREDRWGRIVALSDEFRATEGREAAQVAPPPQLEDGGAVMPPVQVATTDVESLD